MAEDPALAVARFVDALKKHPAKHRGAQGDRLQLYMMDLSTGKRTLIADEPAPGLDCCGSPIWSNDGSRIVFDATTGRQFQNTRLMAVEIQEGIPKITDLGAGNCPSLSPDGKKIAFMFNGGAKPGEEAGVWVMWADGSDRRRAADHGAPFWSPDGREFLINDNSSPTNVLVINLATEKAGHLAVADHKVFSWPRWAGPGRIVACIGPETEADSIVLLDVTKPAQANITETLWKRGPELNVRPLWPLYWPAARRCIFIGLEGNKRSLFTIMPDAPMTAKPMESQGYTDRLGGLSFSPDGRYLLFSGNRPERE